MPNMNRSFLNCDVAFVLDAAHPERVFLGPPESFYRQGWVCHVHYGELPVFVTDAVNVEAIMEAPATVVRLPVDANMPPQHGRGTRTRRPPNAYILYRKDRHEEVKAANPGISNNEICKFPILPPTLTNRNIANENSGHPWEALE